LLLRYLARQLWLDRRRRRWWWRSSSWYERELAAVGRRLQCRHEGQASVVLRGRHAHAERIGRGRIDDVQQTMICCTSASSSSSDTGIVIIVATHGCSSCCLVLLLQKGELLRLQCL
jgi:hypothetical protein